MINALKQRINDKIIIMLLYLAACFLYMLVASKMSVPVHLEVDEELYLAMAKSFHYEHNFQKAFEYLNYNCVLYSMLISLAYFWFTPEHIMTIVRFINVIVMCSAVFPVYLLAYDILHSKKKALIVGGFVLLIPDMVDSVYAMQEILCFPLLMWYFWCVYRDLKKPTGQINAWCVAAVILSVLLFFTKTNMMVILPAYILCSFWKPERKRVKKTFFIFALGAVLVFLGMQGISFLNGWHTGSNHYAKQILALFPITGKTFISLCSGLVFYIVFFLLNTGILPVTIPYMNRKFYSQMDRRFLLYVTTGLLLMILEIVGTIFLTEESGNLYPHKYLFRYFFGFGVPYIILFLKQEKNDSISAKKLFPIYLFVACYMIGYYFILGNGGSTAIMDSHINVLIENMIRIAGRWMGVLVGVAFLIFSGLWLSFVRKGKLRIKFLTISMAVMVLFLFLNSWQQPYYSNVISGGEQNEADFVALGDFLGEERREVYYLGEKLDEYALFYGYIAQDYKWIRPEEMDEIVPGGIVVSPKASFQLEEGYERVDLGCDQIEVWEKTS